MPHVRRSGQPDIHYVVDDYTDPWKNAPYLVLQHGNGRSSRFWYGWVPYLSRYYRIVRPDARGLGASSADFDLEREVTVEALIGDLIGVLDAVGAESVHFCGESMGGILGLALAAMHPARVRTLSLVSTPVYISDKMKQTYSMGHKSRIDAMKEMGRDAWLKATNRSTRFPPESDPGLLDWYEAEFAKSSADVQLAFAKLVNGANAASFLPQIPAQKLRVLAVTSAKRSPVMPDLPTMAEAALPRFDVTGCRVKARNRWAVRRRRSPGSSRPKSASGREWCATPASHRRRCKRAAAGGIAHGRSVLGVSDRPNDAGHKPPAFQMAYHGDVASAQGFSPALHGRSFVTIKRRFT